jgi:hypothetical protein
MENPARQRQISGRRVFAYAKTKLPASDPQNRCGAVL